MKKVVLLSMVLVLCLAAVGIGYAKWSDTLDIDGTVATGSVDVNFANVNGVEVQEAEGKDVGTFTATPSEDTITVSIVNGYPCFGGDVFYNLVNNGTVPVKIESIKLLKVSLGQTDIAVNMDIVACNVYGVQIDESAGPPPTAVVTNLGAAPTQAQLDAQDFTIHLTGELVVVGQQIDPVTMASPPGPTQIAGDLHVHVCQAASQTTIYDFAIQIVCSQWNEVLA